MPQLPHEQGLSNLLMDLARSMHRAQHAPLVVGPFAIPCADHEVAAMFDFLADAEARGMVAQLIVDDGAGTAMARALPKVRS